MKRRFFFQEAARAAIGAIGSLAEEVRGDDADAAAPPRLTPFTTLRHRLTLQLLQRHPIVSTRLGGAAVSGTLLAADARLRDHRPGALDDEVGFLRGAQRELAAMDTAGFSLRDRVDHRVMSARVLVLLHALETRRDHDHSPHLYVAEPIAAVRALLLRMGDVAPRPPGATTAADRDAANPAGENAAADTAATADALAADAILDADAALDHGGRHAWERVLARVEAVPDYLRAARQNLLEGRAEGRRPDRLVLTALGIDAGHAAADWLGRDLPRRARRDLEGRDFAPALLQRLDTLAGRAADALRDFADFLGRTYQPDTDPDDRFAVGRDEYEWRLANDLREPTSAEALWIHAGSQVRHCHELMRDLARRVAADAGAAMATSGTDDLAPVRDALRHLARDTPRDGDEALAWLRDAADRAVDRARRLGLLHLPDAVALPLAPDDQPPDDVDLDRTATHAPGAGDRPLWTAGADAPPRPARYRPGPPLLLRDDAGRLLVPAPVPGAAATPRTALAARLAREGLPGRAWHHRVMIAHAGEIDPFRWLTTAALEHPADAARAGLALDGWAHYAGWLLAEDVIENDITDGAAAGEALWALLDQLLGAALARVDVGLHTGRLTFDAAVDYLAAEAGLWPDARSAVGRDPAARALLARAERAVLRCAARPTRSLSGYLGKHGILALRAAWRQRRGEAYAAEAFHGRVLRMGPVATGYYRDLVLLEDGS